MKIVPIDPPRAFSVADGISMKDCARIELEPDEQVTFLTETGAEYDVARKSWGYYATPSLNGRLARFGLRAALVKNSSAKFYVMLVEKGREDDFAHYLSMENEHVVTWLDDDVPLQELEAGLDGGVG